MQGILVSRPAEFPDSDRALLSGHGLDLRESIDKLGAALAAYVVLIDERHAMAAAVLESMAADSMVPDDAPGSFDRVWHAARHVLDERYGSMLPLVFYCSDEADDRCVSVGSCQIIWDLDAFYPYALSFDGFRRGDTAVIARYWSCGDRRHKDEAISLLCRRVFSAASFVIAVPLSVFACAGDLDEAREVWISMYEKLAKAEPTNEDAKRYHKARMRAAVRSGHAVTLVRAGDVFAALPSAKWDRNREKTVCDFPFCAAYSDDREQAEAFAYAIGNGADIMKTIGYASKNLLVDCVRANRTHGIPMSDLMLADV